MSTEDEGPLSSDLPESEDRTITVISPAAAAPAPVELPEPVHATAEKPLCTVGRRKAARIRETPARVVAAGNPGCLMQIRQHCRALGLEVEVVHPVTLLARALAEPEVAR